MNIYAQQLVRLSELLAACSDVVRDIMKVEYFGDEAASLNQIASDLEELSAEVKRIGFVGPPPTA